MIGHRATQLIQIEIFFLTMAWVAVLLRVYARAIVVKAFGWDDGWMIFAQLMHTLNSLCAIGGALTGTGRLMKDLTPEGMMMALRFWWICYMAYCLTMIGAKVSVGLSLLRITPFTKRNARWIILIVIYTSVITGSIFGLLTTFECKPVDYFWTRALGETGTCISMDVIIAFTYVMSAIFGMCDFTFAILPIFLIKGLNMSRGAKIALIPILSMACIASAAVLVRLAYVQTFRDPEFLYATVPIAIWSEIEMSLAITAGSLPTLRPLYRVAAKKFSWKTSLFSARRSQKSTVVGSRLKRDTVITGVHLDRSGYPSCSESERKIVSRDSEDVVLEEYTPPIRGKSTDIVKVTKVQVEYGNKDNV